MFLPVMVVEWDVELVGEGVDDGSADAQTGKRAGAGEKGNFCEVVPRFAVFGELVGNELMKTFGEVSAGLPFVLVVVELEIANWGRSIKIELHTSIITHQETDDILMSLILC